MSIQVHHLNCGTMCPFGGRFMGSESAGVGAARLVCHCLLIETGNELVLVDTGFGAEDIRARRPRLSEFFLRLNRPRLSADETALAQIEKLGFRAEDVGHIVLTHLDFDHAGGIADFPRAQVHLLGDEFRSAHRVRRLIDIARYRPLQWARERQWNSYEPGGERWFGFQAVRDLEGLPPEILLVPLVGHTWGHSGVAVRLDSGRWLLHAGDAFFDRHEMSLIRPSCAPGLSFYQRMMEVDRASRLWNQGRLRELVDAHGNEVRVFSAHDPRELEWAQAQRELERAKSQADRSREIPLEIGSESPAVLEPITEPIVVAPTEVASTEVASEEVGKRRKRNGATADRVAGRSDRKRRQDPPPAPDSKHPHP